MQIGDDGTLELDIDVISEPALWKIYQLIVKHAPDVKTTVERDFRARAPVEVAPKSAPPKNKHKPMSAREQEARIARLGNKLGIMDDGSPTSPGSQTAAQHTEPDSSGDEASDSEEE